MKCVILCGGKGERLMPLTRNTKKAFLPLGSKRVVDHIIGRLPEGISYSFNLNDCGALAALAEVVEGDEPIMVICGDNYFSHSLESFVAAFSGETLIGVYDVGSREKARQYGVVEFYAGERRIKSLFEKPQEPQATIVSTGLYIFPPSTFSSIQNLAVVAPRGNIGNMVNYIIATRPIYGFPIAGVWIDIGTHEGYDAAVRFQKARESEELSTSKKLGEYQYKGACRHCDGV